MTTTPTFDHPEGWEPPPSKPFTLTGKTLTTGERWTEDFSILGDVPQGALTDLAGSVQIVNGNIVYNSTATVRFLRACIVPGDEARFDALVRDKDRPVPLEQLGEVMMWAAGLSTDRPSGPPSNSGPGRRDDEAGSEAEPSKQDAVAAGSTA